MRMAVHIYRRREIIRANYRLTVCEDAAEFNISTGSGQTLLIVNVQMLFLSLWNVSEQLNKKRTVSAHVKSYYAEGMLTRSHESRFPKASSHW